MGASVLLSLVMTVGLASPAFGASPTDPPPVPSASSAVTATPGVATVPPATSLPSPHPATPAAPKDVCPAPGLDSARSQPAGSVRLSPRTQAASTQAGCPTTVHNPAGPRAAESKQAGASAAPAAASGPKTNCLQLGLDPNLPGIDCPQQAGAAVTTPAAETAPAATSGIQHTISGTVTGSGGAPLANARVYIGPVLACWCSNYSTKTAANGTYSVAVSAATYAVWFEDVTGTYLSGFYTTTGVTVHAASETPVSAVSGDATGINGQLQTGNSIKGTITGPGSVPAAGVDVNVSSSDYRGFTQTAANGSYSVAVPAGSYTVNLVDTTGVYLNGYYNGTLAGHFTFDFGTASSVTVGSGDHSGIDVQLPTGSYIKGTVTGPGGTPLAGITVYAYDSDTGYFGLATTATNGTYSVDLRPSTYQVQFYDNSNTYFSASYPGPVQVTSGNTTGIDVQLERVLHIKGKVTAPGGAPLSNVGVSASAAAPDYSYYGATTGSDGNYSIDLVADDYTLYFEDPTGTYLNGYYSSGGFTVLESGAGTVTVGSVDRTGIDVQLGSGHYIKGTVTGTGAAPLENISVDVYSAGYAYSGRTVTAPNGTYAVAAPAGDYTVQFSDMNGLYFGGYYSSGGLTDQEYLATLVTVGTSDRSGISVQLETGYYISGTVTGTGGGALSGVRVSASDADGSPSLTPATGPATSPSATVGGGGGGYYYDITASNGTYSLYVPTGTFTVYFDDQSGAYLHGYYSSSGFTPFGGSATPIPVGTSSVGGINVSLGTGYQISGTVTGTGGVPLQDIYVDAFSQDYGGYGTTDANGDYSVRVPGGSYTVEFDSGSGPYLSGYYSVGGFTTSSSDATPVSVTTGDVTSINVQMQTGSYITGTVTGLGGLPLDGIEVDLNATGYYNYVWTDSDGNYSIVVSPGDYTVSFYDGNGIYLPGYYSTGGFTLDSSSATPVTVGSSDRSGIDVQMQAGKRIRGTVTSTGGAPLQDVAVSADSGDSHFYAMTSSDGTYTVLAAPGDYVVRFRDYNGRYLNGYYSTGGFVLALGSATTLTVGASDRTGIDVHIPPAGHIRGTVTGMGGAPLASIEVDGFSEYAGGYEGFVWTGSDGTYSLAVPAGSYYLWFYDGNGKYASAYYYAPNDDPYVTVETSDVPGCDIALTPVPATYHPVAPVRLLDTRSGNGLSGKLTANVPRTFQITGRGGIPGNATAITGNVTVVGPTFSWAVYLGPVPTASPTSSTINFSQGDIAANGLTVALSPTGSLSATFMSFSGNTTDLVFDVTGYFTPDTSGATYHPMTPARLLDTRYNNGLSGKISANTPATFQIRGRGNVPANATAVTGNVTVVNSTFSWAVYLGPNPVASPTSSTINFNAGDIKANGLTVALSASGTLSATFMSFAGNTIDLIFDVTGYYTADLSGAKYVPLNPARLLDTRSANGLSGFFVANTARTFQVAGRGGVPTGAKGVSGNVTVVNSTYSWAVFVGPVATNSPESSTINFNASEIKANGLTVALDGTGGLSATYMSFAGNKTDLIFDVTGYFVP